ncbi:MAG: hypothetical protein WCI04_07015 [archaeon]
MTTTVKKLFNKFGIAEFYQVQWNTTFNETEQGVYIVSTSNDADKNLGITDKPTFDDQQIELWISKLPDFKVDGITANLKIVKNRLTNFWLPDESILYIGKAPTRISKKGIKSGISKRVSEYYKTKIGNRSPHSGGQWIKALKDLNTFTVYYGCCNKPAETESKMLEFFMSNVSKSTLSKLHDKDLPIPFANLKFSIDKKHGLENQRLKKGTSKILI